MRAPGIKARMRAGETLLNGWLMVPSTLSAELVAHAGFDTMTIDMQHGMIEFRDMLAMLAAITTSAAAPMVRLPWLDPGFIMKVLDAGAHGVICPMINTAADAETFVAATRYAPLGNRSWGPVRAALFGEADYRSFADREVLNMAMIETRQAVENIDAICSVPGLDAIYIGPGDLSLSMAGRVIHDTLDGEIGEAILHVMERARAHGVLPCSHSTGAAHSRRLADMGFSLVTCCNDAQLLAKGAAAMLAEVRGTA